MHRPDPSPGGAIYRLEEKQRAGLLSEANTPTDQRLIIWYDIIAICRHATY